MYKENAILAADAGGTKTVTGLFSFEYGLLNLIDSREYSSGAYASLADIVSDFLEGRTCSIISACIGVPGPVVNASTQTTNLPWELNESMLANDLDIESVKLINDLAASAYALPYLNSEDLIVLHEGFNREEHGVSVILSPGTGLGSAILIESEDCHDVIASESGHRDFAPQGDLQEGLLSYLREKFGHVSYERILSGPGILNIYKYLDNISISQKNMEVSEELKINFHPSVITRSAMNGQCSLCVKTMELFVSVLGAQAGNLALELMATRGVYLGGGIIPRITDLILNSDIIDSFLNKGRMDYLLAKTPLYIIKDTSTPLKGAACVAYKLACDNGYF